MTDVETLMALMVGGALGLVVGLERQLTAPDDDGYAGARTFALYGAMGAASGLLGERYGAAGFVIAAAIFAALLLVAYVTSSQQTGDWGVTTETAALLVFFAGWLAFESLWVAAIGLTVAVTAVLRGKDLLHRLSTRFSDQDVRAVIQFGVVTAVILPLVPDQAFGAFDGFNPREVWLMVVFVSAIGLAGYVALRVLGMRGLALTGLLGGLVSSTAVTLSFSRLSRETRHSPQVVAAGVLGACGLMYPRVMVEALVLAPDLAMALAPWLVAAFGFTEAVALVYWLRSARRPQESAGVEFSNPLTLTVAIGFALVYAVVAFLSRAAVALTDDRSLSLVGAVSGLNDVDAITLSMGNLVRTGLDVPPAAAAVLAAVTANALVKAGLAFFLGRGPFRRQVALILVAAAGLTAVAWWMI
ncbi:MAG TPA: DUF4010 domain-containing protein [Acidimicrobiia bacterium]|nr:DUF4010 domain-containing protein [Acidimicrobiia bacterium]